MNRPTDSEPLDLKRHRPDEFFGKTVTLDGRDYRIGARIREGSQGYFHRLTNQRSEVCLHAIQVRVEYLQSAAAALQASLAKEAANAQLVSKMRLSTPSVAMSFLTVKQAHGGSFEVHEFPTGAGWPGQETPPPGDEAIRDAQTLMAQSDFATAVSRLTQVLAVNPDQTIALNSLAQCYLSLRNLAKAYEVCTRIVEIEPNLAFYRASQIRVAIRMPSRSEGSRLFGQLQARYPKLRYFDSLEVQAYLAVGEAEKARDLMRTAMLGPTEVATLQPIVEAAVSANERFTDLEPKLRDRFMGSKQSVQTLPSDVEVLRVLEQTNASYPANPFIQANLAARLRKARDFKRAAELFMSAAGGVPAGLVPYCWTNAAYCLISLSDWRRAMELLKTTMSFLPRDSTGHVAPSDVPGLIDWVYRPGRVIETLDPPAARLLDRAITDCPDKSLVTPEILEMATLLRQFATSIERS